MNTTTNLPIAPSQQMALRISGTKQRQAGFAPLVSVGVLAGNEGVNMDRATTVAEKPVYVIKHTSDYILYQVIDREVKSFDADAPGVLSIALTIPRQFQLSDAQSPYTLLKEVYEKFVSEFMRPNNDGRDCFLNTDIDSNVFRSILQNYSLEARKTGYVTMNPAGLTATLRLSKDKIVDFFRDSQYGELAQFKDVEIGEKCQSFPGLDNLKIPRPVKYDVYVNEPGTLSTNGHNDNGMGRPSTISNERNLEVSHKQGEMQSPPAVSAEERIAKEKERERRKCERRKALLIAFAIGLLLGAGVGYVIGHYIVPNHQTTESLVKPTVEDAKGTVSKNIFETPETPEQRVNKWLRKDEVSKVLKEYSKSVNSVEDLIKKALANTSNEEDKAMLKDIQTFESSKKLVESYWEEVKTKEEKATRLQQELLREKEAAEAVAKEEARKKILELVNKRDLPGCQKQSGWNKYLTDKERGAIEAILNMKKYEKEPNRKAIVKFLEDKKFSNYDSIIATQRKIWELISPK